MPVKHGVELENFEAFAEHAAENPDEVQFELGARSTYEGTCAHSLANDNSARRRKLEGRFDVHR